MVIALIISHLAALAGGVYLGYKYGRSVEAKAQAAADALKESVKTFEGDRPPHNKEGDRPPH